MLTPSYAQTTNDPHLLQAMLWEWSLREIAFRKAHPEEVPEEERLAAMIPARDAGDVCGVCGQVVTWVEHLPPLKADGVVRCFVGVSYLPAVQGFVAAAHAGVVIDDIFPRVENTDAEERAFRESFGYAVNDPKHPDYHDTFSDASDMREDF